ncbi:MAG: creatininase family protein [Betaproteobacteria bacterium]|nr:creatininase family protein [Betaproteobacteria bacterium]
MAIDTPAADAAPAGLPSGLPGGYWQELATTDFARIDPARTIALLPVAAIEQHGPHLPLATDALINQGVVAQTMQRLPPSASVLVLPALTIGDSLEHTAFPGTLSADLHDLLGLWLAVGRSVARAGEEAGSLQQPRRTARAHVDLAALRLRVSHHLLVVRAHSFFLRRAGGPFEADELAHGLHGGAVETSLVMHLRPDLVRTAKLADFPSLGAALARRGGLLGAEKPVGIGWMTQDLNAQGACGNAAAASAEKGARLLDHMAGSLAQLLAEVEAMPLPVSEPGPGSSP